MELYAWTEKYRPKTVAECVLPKRLKELFKGTVESGQIPDYVFHGQSGMGKTSVACAMCMEIGADFLLIPASDETGIDVLRNKVRRFATTMSADGGRKYIIYDEADKLAQSTLGALRGFMEECSINASFIFTANNLGPLTKHLDSRTSTVEFFIPPDEREKLMVQMFKVIMGILDKEKVECPPEVLKEHLVRYFPDYRKTIKQLHSYAVAFGKIDSGILTQQSVELDAVVEMIKQKRFKSIADWAYSTDVDSSFYSNMFKYLYDEKKLHKDSVPNAALIFHDYEQASLASVPPHLTALACLTQIMMKCEFN